MNTFRIFSLFALMGLASAPIAAMVNEPSIIEELMQKGKDAVHNRAQRLADYTAAPAPVDVTPTTETPVVDVTSTIVEAKEITEVSATLPENAKPVVSAALSKGAKVYELLANHPWYTAGAVAIIIGGGTYVLYRTGKLQSMADFAKKHPLATTAVVGTIAVATANHYGYLDLDNAKQTATDWGYWAWEKMPSVSTKAKVLIGTGTAIVGGFGYILKSKTSSNAPKVSSGSSADARSSSSASSKSAATVTGAQPGPMAQAHVASSSAPTPPAQTGGRGWFSRGPSKAAQEKAQLKGAVASLIKTKDKTKKQAILDAAKPFNDTQLNNLIHELFTKTIDCPANNWALNFNISTTRENLIEKKILAQPGVQVLFNYIDSL